MQYDSLLLFLLFFIFLAVPIEKSNEIKEGKGREQGARGREQKAERRKQGG
jgi:hypothetical protein